MSVEELQLKEKQKLYPPRFVATVRGSSTAEDSKAVFTFEGATRKISREIILAKGICRYLWWYA